MFSQENMTLISNVYSLPEGACVELEFSSTFAAGVFLCDGGGVDIPMAKDGLKNVSDW